MPCGLQLPIITQWSSADPAPLQPLFYPSPRMLWWRRGVPLSLGRVIARFHSLSGRLWLALHQIRSSGYPPCPDTPAQPPPLSPHALLVGAVRCFCWPRCIQAPYYYHPASVPPVPITAAIQIWCQHTHTPVYNIQLAECRLALLSLPRLVGSLPSVAAARRVSSALLFRHQMHTYTLCNSLPQLHSVATIGATANDAHANHPR